MAVRKKVVRPAASKVKTRKGSAKASPSEKTAKAAAKAASEPKAKKKAGSKPASKLKTKKKVASKVSGKKSLTKKATSKVASKTKPKKQALAKPEAKKRVASKAIPQKAQKKTSATKKTGVTKKTGRTKASAATAELMVPAPSRVFVGRPALGKAKKGGLAQPELETLSTGDTFGPSTPMDPKAAAEVLRAAFSVESPFSLHKSEKRAVPKEGEPGYGFAVAARAAADEVINAVLGELGAIGEFDEIE
jgi:C1A family cysteine protease